MSHREAAAFFSSPLQQARDRAVDGNRQAGEDCSKLLLIFLLLKVAAFLCPALTSDQFSAFVLVSPCIVIDIRDPQLSSSKRPAYFHRLFSCAKKSKLVTIDSSEAVKVTVEDE